MFYTALILSYHCSNADNNKKFVTIDICCISTNPNLVNQILILSDAIQPGNIMQHNPIYYRQY